MYVNTNNIDMAKIAVNKSLLKEYNTSTSSRTVYLNDGDEYQIQLYNPTDDDIAASIYIDNKSLSRQLVIRPGERIWLERYLDVAKKFKFSTYEVEDNAETENAISHNGEIKIMFYEKTKLYSISTDYLQLNLNSDNYIIKQPDIMYKGSCDYLSNCNAAEYCSSTSDCITKGITSCTNATLTTSAASCATNSLNFSAAQPTSTTIETGRTGKGSHSSQKFENVNEDFNYWSFKTETIKILPISRKPATSEDLEKLYCTECGRKLKTKYKFCPYCGTRIE